MKILVMGGGAIGSLFAGLLSKNNYVTLIGRKDHVDKINKNGLKIIGKTSMNVKIPAFDSLDKINFQPDLILLTVKSYDTEMAIIELLKILGRKTLLLTIQNGLDNLHKMKGKLKKEQIIAGTTTNGAIFDSPGVINHTGEGYTYIGEINGGITQRIKKITNVFNIAGIKTKTSKDILKEIWIKAIVNSCINPLTAFFEIENGYLIENKILEKILEKICEESTKIANTQGFIFSSEEMIRNTKHVIMDTKKNRSSMYQSLIMGKKTEIDSINGKLVEIGKKNKANFSLNEILINLVKTKYFEQ